MFTNWFSQIQEKYNRLNHFLITRHPFLWQTQVHLAVLFSLFFGLLSFIAGISFPISFRELSSPLNDLARIKYNAGAVCISISLIFLIYWRKKIVQYKHADFSWKLSISEAVIYFMGILFLWGASNMFNFGLNLKAAYFTLKGEQTYNESLQRTHYFTNGYLPHADLRKVNDLYTYFDHGDSLAQMLLSRATDPNSPDVKIKKYYPLLNQNVLEEQFYNAYDSLYAYNDTIWVKKRRKVMPKIHYGPTINREFFEKNNNYTAVDTLLKKFVNSNLRYSFDEFVPKLHFDNYFTVADNIPVSQLGFDNYKKLIDSADYLTSGILFDDMLRMAQAQKWLIARRNFLHSLTKEQAQEYQAIIRQLHQVFGGNNELFMEFALNRPITTEMLKTFEDQYRNPREEERHRQYMQNTEDVKIKQVRNIHDHKVDSIARFYYNRDSIALSERLKLFVQKTNTGARGWYQCFVEHFGQDFTMLRKSYYANIYASTAYFDNSIDTLLTLYPSQGYDTVFFNSGQSPLYNDAYYQFQRTVDSTLNAELYNRQKYPALSGLIKKTNPDWKRNPKYYYQYEYSDISEENDALRNVLLRLIKTKAFPNYFECNQSEYVRSYSMLKKGKLVYEKFKGRKITGTDSIAVDINLIREEIIQLSGDLRKLLADYMKRTPMLQTGMHEVYSNGFVLKAVHDIFYTDSILFRDTYMEQLIEKAVTSDGTKYNWYDYYSLGSNEPGVNLGYMDQLSNANTLGTLCYLNYLSNKNSKDYTPENLQFFRMNGFDVPEVRSGQEAFQYISYYGTDMARGIREVYRARKQVQHFISEELFQPHILSLLVFVLSILFFTVSFETRVITAAFALGFLMLILLNFFLGKFMDVNQLANATASFPSPKQKIVFATILAPLALSLGILLFVRRRVSLPGFLMNMVIVFALSLLTTNPALYYGDNLQKVDITVLFQSQQQSDTLTQYDLFYYLTLYLGLALTIGALFLRRNQVLPEGRK